MSGEYCDYCHELADLFHPGEHNAGDVLEQLGGVEQIMAKLGTDPKDGIDPDKDAIAQRKKDFGVNEFKQRPMPSIFRLWYEAWDDLMVKILTAAAFIALILGVAFPEDGNRGTGWVDGFAILAAVVIVCTVTAVQDWTQAREFRRLNKINAQKQVDVVRGGLPVSLMDAQLLVGDIIRIKSGADVPADILLLQGSEVKSNEIAVTGESVPVPKTPKVDPFLHSGSTITNGTGLGLILAVGPNSQKGKISDAVQKPPEETPLQEKLGTLALNIGYIGMAVALIVFIVLMIYWVMDIFLDGHGWYFGRLLHILEFFIISITIIVVAVPEGLPLAVTIALSYSMRQMMKDNNLVKRLHGCETMGGATIICSDKTGTLTTGQMSVVCGWVAGDFFENTKSLSMNDVVRENLTTALCINSDPSSYVEEKEDGGTIYRGSPTECALLLFVNELGEDYMTMRSEVKDFEVDSIPFNSERKRMSTVMKTKDGRFRMYTKGASEIVLDRCTQVMHEDGSLSPLTDDLKQKLLAKIDDIAREGLRTLSIAMRDFEVYDNDDDVDPAEGDMDEQDRRDKGAHLEQKLTLLAVTGIKDPVREDVPASVKRVHRAGVRVIMITGDKLETARTIARECGILDDDANSIQGPDFRKLSLEEQKELLKTLQVMARSSPQDKFDLVTVLKEHLFQLVAVTGDGTNDAPALSKAHVGLAMGSGTDVAKSAASIIIQDDSFISVVAAVKWGRSIFDNIRKFLQFQLCVNVAALCVAFIGAVTRAGTPLKAIQLLWVNLIMDSMGALALATERPTEALLERDPINVSHPKMRLLSNKMWVNIIGQSMYQVGILCLLLFVAPYFSEDIPAKSDEHFTMIFNAFVWCQLFNEVNARKVNGEWNIFEGIYKNWMFGVIIAIEIILQVAIVEIGGPIFKTTGLTFMQWIICIVIGAVSWPLGLVLRLTPTPPDKTWNGIEGAEDVGPDEEDKEQTPDVVSV